jgi:hypothetical protein
MLKPFQFWATIAFVLLAFGCSKKTTIDETDAGIVIICRAGETECGETCVDAKSDPAHCGGCDHACSQVCAQGECASTCEAPTTNCNSACVDTTSSNFHCGACGNACPIGKSCIGSQCLCGPSISFSAKIQPVFNASCLTSGCHEGKNPKANLNLTTGTSYSQLVNVASADCSGRIRVIPYDVSGSYLISKLRGMDMCTGTQMPKVGVKLPSGDMAAIEGWICNGAPKN